MKKEILVISHKYPPSIGGMERHCYELVRHLSEFYTVHKVVHSASDGSKVKWMLTIKKRVQKVLRDRPNIAIIYLNDGLMATACRWLPQVTDIPVVATYHGLDVTFPAGYYQNKLLPQLHRFQLGIAVSEATRQLCIDRGFDPSKTITVVNGVDHDLADIPRDDAVLAELAEAADFDLHEKKILVTMGRAVPRKGFSWFLKSVVPKLPDDTVLIMVGPLNQEQTLFGRIKKLLPSSVDHLLNLFLGYPADEAEVNTLLQSPNLANKALHLGKLPFKTLMQVVSAADVFVMPNIKVEGDAEGFGLVALEASLRGTPVIAAGIEGITSAITHGENGLLVPSQDTDAWIQTITTLLSDKARLAELSDRGRLHSKDNYSWSKMAEEYRDAFEELM